MQLIFSEYKPNYKKYEFPYQVYSMREEGDSTSLLYGQGFLPTRIDKRLFYLGRSLRINLSQFELSSENRRVLKKSDYLTVKAVPLTKFKYDYTIGKLGKDFYTKRFGKGVMSAQKIKWLFTESQMTHVLIYTDKKTKKVVGYSLCVLDDGIFHYSYPFYELDYFDKSIGMGMMIRAIEFAKKKNCEYAYLGTVYTKDSKYKLQFSGLEYFIGFGWSDDIENLKELIANPQEEHLLSLIEDKSLFLDGLTYSISNN